MRVESRAETVSIEDGVVHLSFDLADTEAAYLLISCPCEGGTAEDFLGQDHYVEVKDQLFGRYGGLKSLRVEGERQFSIQLSSPIPDVGSKLTIVADQPLSGALSAALQRLERS